MALYTEACTVVRTDAELSKRSGLTSELLYADALVIMARTIEQLGRWVAD